MHFLVFVILFGVAVYIQKSMITNYLGVKDTTVIRLPIIVIADILFFVCEFFVYVLLAFGALDFYHDAPYVPGYVDWGIFLIPQGLALILLTYLLSGRLKTSFLKTIPISLPILVLSILSALSI